MEKWFMLHKNGHHHKLDDGLYLHYPDTCNVFDMTEAKYSGSTMWGDRKKSMSDPFFYPSKFGWVVVWYEQKGRLSLFVQISENRAAWQRLEWSANYQKNLNDNEIKEAVNNFLWVAESEYLRIELPKMISG